MEAAIFDTLTKPLITNGLSGVVIIGLAFAVYRVSNAYHSIQEARISETKDMVRAMGDMTNSLNTLADLIKDRVKG